MHTPQTETHYAALSALLSTCLDLRQPAISISFTDTIPSTISSYKNRVAAGCRFWQNAATATFATSASDHSLCAIGCYTHNLPMSSASQTDLGDALHVLGQMGYVTEKDLGAIPVLQSPSQHIVYGPLAEAPLPPDVVMLFVNANQTLILSEATQQVEEQNPPAMGRPACAVVPQVLNTGRAALSLGCCGARAYLDILTDDVALFAIPGAKLEAYAQRIEVLSKANSVLSKFHQIRRNDIESGQIPTIKDSLAALQAQTN
jgi:uncharacterized protein (DUF169 family)